MATPKPGPMDRPTGPTGILQSARPHTAVGGKKPSSPKKAMVCSPGRSMGGMKKGARY